MSVRQNKRARNISIAKAKEFHQNPVLITQVDPYIHQAMPFDLQQPFYRWVLYDKLSETNKDSLPLNIHREVLRFKNELKLGMHRLPDYYPPEIVIRQNVSDPSDLKCELCSNPIHWRKNDGISPTTSFKDPFDHKDHEEEIDEKKRAKLIAESRAEKMREREKEEELKQYYKLREQQEELKRYYEFRGKSHS